MQFLLNPEIEGLSQFFFIFPYDDMIVLIFGFIDVALRSDRLIIANIERIMFYIEGHDKDSFVRDIHTSDAAERCLQRITEAAIKLQPLAGDLLLDQNWKAIRDLGNMLRHQYERI